MIRNEIKTKYTCISFNEEYDNGEKYYWAAVAFAWGEKANPIAVAFAVLMDDRILNHARLLLKDAVNDPEKDIYLEDVDMLITLNPRFRHIAARLIGLVESLEAEFDAELERGRALEIK